jgi:hypothetical protein
LKRRCRGGGRKLEKVEEDEGKVEKEDKYSR